jgi:hypothetical protein
MWCAVSRVADWVFMSHLSPNCLSCRVHLSTGYICLVMLQLIVRHEVHYAQKVKYMSLNQVQPL